MDWNNQKIKLQIDRLMATKFFSIVTNIVDDLLEDWLVFFVLNIF